MDINNNHKVISDNEIDERVTRLLSKMTQEEKIGQLCQLSGAEGWVPDHLRHAIQSGMAGSVINEVDVNTVNELQRIALEESRLGIPLLIGRDVIHGYKTIFPIPLGQAASWSADTVEKGAMVAAREAKLNGVNWTFAPMIDISRDPRWGRIAESLGEDPFLCAQLGTAMVKGFQGDDFTQDHAIAACAKHFCGYGAAESGRDYCTTNIPENELRNVYMVPFKAASDAGVATFMSSFSDIDGIPASGNQWLMTDILRDEWQFDGFVVSDWESISQLMIHGLCEHPWDAAKEAYNAGIDMEMVSTTYRDHLSGLMANGEVDGDKLDTMVSRILAIKFKMGLFDNPNNTAPGFPEHVDPAHLSIAKQAAIESCVLLQNNHSVLPLNARQMQKLTVVGPLADDGYEQLGTWIFDGEERHSTTILRGIEELVASQTDSQDCTVAYHRAMQTSRSDQIDQLEQIQQSVAESDAVVLVLGEESILSGEAHCRAELNLPGCQQQLIETLSSQNKPIVLVILAGRPLTLEAVIPHVDAILYAWHPGTMGGPAIAELLFGVANPSGKLPVSFPRKVGQIPIYYSQKESGKPVNDHNFMMMQDIPVRAAQTSLGMAASHLDTHFTPQFPFGFGLSYASYHYSNLRLSQHQFTVEETLNLSVDITNTSDVDGVEIVQLYIRDHVGSITRPAKELKGFKSIALKGGEQQTVNFALRSDDLAFYGRDRTFKAETGRFTVWIGPNSADGLSADFELIINE